MFLRQSNLMLSSKGCFELEVDFVKSIDVILMYPISLYVLKIWVIIECLGLYEDLKKLHMLNLFIIIKFFLNYSLKNKLYLDQFVNELPI